VAWSLPSSAMAATVAMACARSREEGGEGVRRKGGLGPVALVLYHAERGTDTRQRRRHAASMVEVNWCMVATPAARAGL
jgi:hypothetical protein